MILQKTRDFYKEKASFLNSFLEETNFLDTSDRYPHSVVIRFGVEKFLGEASVWQSENGSYIEFEYVDLMDLKMEPVFIVREITEDTVEEELTVLFSTLVNFNNQ